MDKYRIDPQSAFNFSELVVDNFAGGGGASTGIESAIGRPVDIAINHNPIALAMHEVNHPHTKHYCESVWDIDPRKVCAGRSVGLAWFSPDCRHFSKAKGGAPVSPRVRGLAWVVLRWAATVRPRIICLENVEEFRTWGPLIKNEDGSYSPCEKRKGQTFRSFINALKKHGYKVETKELRACDYGAPTIRNRLFMVARCDGLPIVWPEKTHGHPESQAVKRKLLSPWKNAASIIDWSIPCPSIFERKRPLADATCRRIAEGLRRFVVESDDAFIVPIANFNGSNPAHSINEPLRTITAHPKGGHLALVQAFLAKHYTGVVGTDIRKPLGTVTTVDHHSLVTSQMVKLRGSNIGSPVTDPVHTISAGGTHHAEVRAFLIKYYGNEKFAHLLKDPIGTIPTKDRFGIVHVLVKGEPYVLYDIGMRMLQPHELFAAQGFPDNYITDRLADGSKVTKTDQVRMCGNSVCPPLAEAIVKANFSELSMEAIA